MSSDGSVERGTRCLEGKCDPGHSGEVRKPTILRAARLRWQDVRVARNGVPAKRGSARRHLPPVRDSLALKIARVYRSAGGGPGFEVVEHLVNACAPDSVRQAVMHLCEEGYSAVLETSMNQTSHRGRSRSTL